MLIYKIFYFLEKKRRFMIFQVYGLYFFFYSISKQQMVLNFDEIWVSTDHMWRGRKYRNWEGKKNKQWITAKVKQWERYIGCKHRSDSFHHATTAFNHCNNLHQHLHHFHQYYHQQNHCRFSVALALGPKSASASMSTPATATTTALTTPTTDTIQIVYAMKVYQF